MKQPPEQLRQQILNLVKQYHDVAFEKKDFIAGDSAVPVSGKVFDATELQLLVDSSLDFWLTTGRFAAEFEKKFASLFGLNNALLVNSGSSANLLAVSALCSPMLGDRQLIPGDEVITVAAGFPTTLNPIIQNQLVPVFLDVEIPTYNIDITQLQASLSNRTRAIILAHTLGNPFNLAAVTDFAKKNNLWLIEDCCDAVGSNYAGKPVGTFGDMATTSFYPAHHITMGEGGAVLTNDPKLKIIVQSLRDWGRDCWCDPGKDNTCQRRYEQQLGDLPHGFDHKYTYSHIGYNLKATDMQAAVGLAQLDKLPGFIESRHKNFQTLYQGFKSMEEFFILPEPTANSQPSWFGFPLAVRNEAPFTRNSLIKYLDQKKIATRLIFGCNLTRQPAYENCTYRIAGDLSNSDFVMNQAFWLGVYPGLTDQMLNYIINTVDNFNE